MTDDEREAFRNVLAQRAARLLQGLTLQSADLSSEGALMFIGSRMLQFGMKMALTHPEWAQAAMQLESAEHEPHVTETLNQQLQKFIHAVPVEVDS